MNYAASHTDSLFDFSYKFKGHYYSLALKLGLVKGKFSQSKL